MTEFFTHFFTFIKRVPAEKIQFLWMVSKSKYNYDVLKNQEKLTTPLVKFCLEYGKIRPEG